MSSKVNVFGIISGHFNTLKDSTSTRHSFQDLLTFFIVPFLVCAAGAYFSFKLNDQLSSLLVNFGAIFTALLLSVLVLVYDQETKISEKIIEAQRNQSGNLAILNLKKRLMNQLYFNICYSIILSLSLVFVCLMEKVVRGHTFPVSISEYSCVIDLDVYLLTPLVSFMSIHLMLTIIMVVKRLHTLLTEE